MGFLQDIFVPETEVLLHWKENKRKKKISPEPCNLNAYISHTNPQKINANAHKEEASVFWKNKIS